MSPAEQVLWLRVMRKVAAMEPDVAAAVLRAFQIVRDTLSETELAQLIQSGDLERVIVEMLSDATLDRAFIPLRQRLRATTEAGFRYATPSLPGAGKIDGTIAVMFDHLNPTVLTAIRTLESKVIDGLKVEIRQTVRDAIEQGLADGFGPRAIARGLRDVIGLGPSQLQQVGNFRAALESGDVEKVLTYTLRDRRFDATLKRLMSAENGGLTETQIERMVAAYTKRRIAQNAETNARTATLDSMKLGQQLSWQSAVDRGIVPPDRLRKTWVGVMDDRERDEHIAMEGETVPYNQTYSNGNFVPGDDTYNCRCVSRFTVAAS